MFIVVYLYHRTARDRIAGADLFLHRQSIKGRWLSWVWGWWQGGQKGEVAGGFIESRIRKEG
jgi:hypothetical protein